MRTPSRGLPLPAAAALAMSPRRMFGRYDKCDDPSDSLVRSGDGTGWDGDVRGIIGAAAYLPHRRLDRTTIAAVAGGGGGKGNRTVASYDEDTTTMGVEAGTGLAGASIPASLRIRYDEF